jgi:sterol desaturase/sphingolipid hydroxylase (fatty acid hydroxylase superfamily)
MLDPLSVHALASSLLNHILGCALAYGVAALIFLGPWTMPILGKYKFDKNHRPRVLDMCREAMFCVLSVVVVTAWDAFLLADMSRGKDSRFTRVAYAAESFSVSRLALLGVGASILGDTHFYWTHRFMHAVPFLYRHVHKTHHISSSPNPLSGLSFHPIESIIYFSSLPFTAALLPMPLGVYRAYKWSLMLAPISTHCGFGMSSGPLSIIHDHHIHHRVAECNFGGIMPWDWLCGTDYQSWRASKKR